ncbi:hypothetical protein [Legionella worsleiensis]|uniref:Uncharacterized protein n=1 Tax=Legionella worsleiensis TaxID=45076 RepID=A0A0W1AEJ9_9GAMM|nr:hypothetical protein [Legionella worsleiensis]KTD79773.1 hypothetical protein Lwor_1287 [Legionella worsleiensis]STY32284.1 Uncharacterised protein [Legionella worsleiensis]
MSSQEDNVQKGFLEEWILNCTEYSNRNLQNLLKRLPYTDTKRLALIHINPKKTSFWKKTSANTQQVFDAIKNNPFIETLELSNDFVKSIPKPLNKQGSYIKATQLENMRSLKHLIVHNQNWDERFFSSLLTFLSSDTCQLESLELKQPLSEEEQHRINDHINESTLLKTSQGSNLLNL